MKEVHGSLPSPYGRYDNGEKEKVDIKAIVFVCREVCALVSMRYKQKRKQNDELIQPEGGQKEIYHTGVNIYMSGRKNV